MKRFFIIVTLLFTLVVGLLAGFVYLFDLNKWVSEQIEESSGYRISFESIESHYWQESRFSVRGLSVAADKTELLHIDKINIVIGELDLWARKLEVELVELAGVDFAVAMDTLKKASGVAKNTVAIEKKQQPLPWSELQVNKLRITALNADISNAQQGLRLLQASLSSDNLLIIEDNKLLDTVWQGSLQFSSKALNLRLQASQVVAINDLSLRSHFNLADLKASLAAEVKQFAYSLPEQREVIVNDALLKMQLDKNRLTLSSFSARLFSGELALQAEAQLAMRLLPAPAFSIDKLTVLSLLAKDMQIQIPAFMQDPENKKFGKADEEQQLPIKTLFLKQIDLQNIAVSSEEKQFPLTVKGGNLHLQDFYLLQNYQLFNLSAENQQSGVFTLSFDYLQWQDSITEQFQGEGNFTKDVQKTLILKELPMSR